MDAEWWCVDEGGNTPVGHVWVVVDAFGRPECRKVVAERVRYISREEREDCDDFFAPAGYFRQIGVVTVTEAEAFLDPTNAAILAQAEATRARIQEELSRTPVVYETDAAWWLEPRRGKPVFGACYAFHEGLGEWSWYRRVGDRVQILERGCWDKAVKMARLNDYLRDGEPNIPPEVFDLRRKLCDQYAELPCSTREELLAEIAEREKEGAQVSENTY